VNNPIERPLQRVDRWQQGNRPAGFVYGVIKKFSDDGGGRLTGLITFYGFVSLFPLILLVTTVLGFALHGDASLQNRIETSALGQFPLIGDDLRNHALHGNALAVIVGALGLLWGSLGVAQIVEYAANQVWNVPQKERPGFVPRILRALVLYGLLGLAVLATSALTVLGSIVGNSLAAGIAGVVLALLCNIGLFVAVFKLLSPRDRDWRDLAPGAVVGGIGWQILQVVGQALVRHNLRHSSELYGQFAVVLGLISFLGFAAQLFLYSLEINVVLHRHLWPRSILAKPPTKADDRGLELQHAQE
jgi:YihY family inner membrane protein